MIDLLGATKVEVSYAKQQSRGVDEHEHVIHSAMEFMRKLTRAAR